MRRILAALFVGIILNAAFPISNSIAQTAWQSFGPFGGRVNVIAIDPTDSQTIYVGTQSSGVFKSTDGGKSWSGANNGIPSYKQNNAVTTKSIAGIVVDHANSQNVYVKTLNFGVFKSTDAGMSWVEANEGIVTGLSPSHSNIVINPTNSQILYTGVGSNLYKSINGGASWAIIDREKNIPGPVEHIVIDPGDNDILYVSQPSSGIYKSSNGGASWTASNSGIERSQHGIYVKSIAIDRNNGQIIYAGTIGNTGIYKSTDGGATWNAKNSGLPFVFRDVWAVAINPDNSQTIYIGGGYKSINGGESWIDSSQGLKERNTYWIAIDPTDGEAVYVAANMGLFKSTNGGTSWAEANSGMTNSAINQVLVDPTNSDVIYAASSNGTGIFKSVDGGLNWTKSNYGISYNPGDPAGQSPAVYSVTVNPLNSQIVYAGTDLGGFKSTTGGTEWTLLSGGLPNTTVRSLVIDPADQEIIYAGLGSGIYKTINGGSIWARISEISARRFTVDPTDSQTIYAGTFRNGMFKTTDGGETWAALVNGIALTARVNSIAIDPTNSMTVYAGISGGGVLKSVDGGGEWIPFNSGIENLDILTLAIDPSNSQAIYAGARSGDIYKSNSGGDTWTTVDSGITYFDILSLSIAANSQSIYAGTWGGGVFFNKSQPPAVQINQVIHTVYAVALPKEVENSYIANLKKVGDFIANGKPTPAVNQLNATINKVKTDIAKGSISPIIGNKMMAMITTLIDDLKSLPASLSRYPF